jgi:hypothetical protein
MELRKMPIEELVELRTKMILENSDLKQINQIILDKEIEYSKSIILNEDVSATGGPAGAVSGGGDFSSGGVCMSNAGIAGMGNFQSAQPSSYAGTTTGAAFNQGGGTIGSGDISVPFNAGAGIKMFQKIPAKEMGINHGPRTGKKSRKRKLNLKTIKNLFAQRQDFTANQGGVTRNRKIMNFDDFQKNGLTKVTKVKY